LRGRVADRITAYVAARIEVLLAELIALKRATDASGDEGLPAQARGVAFRLVENFGAMSRSQFGEELKQLSQDERAKLRNLGVRFGEYTLHMPTLLKPAAARMMTLLWGLWADKDPQQLLMPKPGLVSLASSQDLPHAYYYALGYRPSGDRAVRIDMLERLAQQIRTARNGPDAKEGFVATSQMMSLVGCSGEEFESILRSLGYRKQTIKRSQEQPAQAETPVLEDAANAAPAPDAVDSPQLAAEAAPLPEPAASIETAPEPVATSAPPAPVEVVATTDIEVTVWRMAPRRPPQSQRPQQNKRTPRTGERGKNADAAPNAQGAREAREGRPPRRDRPDGKKPFRKGSDAPPRQYSSAPRRERGPDPNSPFAVLAALKANMAGGDTKPE
jgi:ATP-dependent RNA helicase SUPV3L1/SUV3